MKNWAGNGIVISHADSHQHIHTSWSMFGLMPSLLKDLRINRCRRLRNYVPSTPSRIIRNVCTWPYKIKGIKMTDTFASFKEYCDNGALSQGSTVELMCHPGHPGDEYKNEYSLLKSYNLKQLNAKLISYKEL